MPQGIDVVINELLTKIDRMVRVDLRLNRQRDVVPQDGVKHKRHTRRARRYDHACADLQLHIRPNGAAEGPPLHHAGAHFIHLPGCVAECDAEREHQHKPAEIHAAQRHVKRAFTVFDILAGADAAKPASQRIAEHDDKECAKRHPELSGAKCFFEFFQHAVHLSDRLAYIVP